MKPPLAFLLGAPVLMIMCIISIGAVLTGEADGLNKALFPPVAIVVTCMAIWRLLPTAMRQRHP